MKPNQSRVWDAYGAAISTLCIVHCLATPLVIAFFPLAFFGLDDHRFHILLVCLATPVTLRVVWEAIAHARPWPFVPLALTGLLLLVAALFSHDLETPLTVVGGVLLSGAHLWRWRQTRLIDATHRRA